MFQYDDARLIYILYYTVNRDIRLANVVRSYGIMG